MVFFGPDPLNARSDKKCLFSGLIGVKEKNGNFELKRRQQRRGWNSTGVLLVVLLQLGRIWQHFDLY